MYHMYDSLEGHLGVVYKSVVQELKQRIFARYHCMQRGVNRRGGDGAQLPNCHAEFLLKIHIADCQVSRGLSSHPLNLVTVDNFGIETYFCD